ncbi:MAG TPA: hypothetical protein VMT47_11020 [Polyangia bacterium]|nr:hypothetical protein [Polyangia bacterium]
MRLADGEVYRVLQRPDLSARYERRRAWKRGLNIGGIPLLIAGFIVSSAVLVAPELQTVASHDSSLSGKETGA